MPEPFTLKAESSAKGEARPVSLDGKDRLTIEPGKVTFTVLSSDGFTPSKAKLNLQGGTGSQDFKVLGNEIQPIELDLSSDGSGDYQALVTYKTADSAEEKRAETNTVTITVKPKSIDPRDGEQGGDSVRETSIGGYDKAFTYVLLIIAILACVAVSWAVWSVIQRIPLPNSAETGSQLFGTWAERTAAITNLVVFAAGAVVLILGTWLAALETRGRLHLGIPVTKARGGASDNLKALAEVIDKSKTLRGSIAVLIAGTVVVATACCAATLIALRPTSPSPVPSPTGGTEAPAPLPPSPQAPGDEPTDGSTAPIGPTSV